ncbi:NAD(+) diphosphatase [Kocuria soli]|nr:NAD(+) diphosphatase [Kocuria soli]
MQLPRPTVLNPDVMPLTRSRLERRSPERDREDQRPGSRWTLVTLDGRMPVADGRLVLVERSVLARIIEGLDDPDADPGLPEVYLGELTDGSAEGVTVRPQQGQGEMTQALTELVELSHARGDSAGQPLEWATLRAIAPALGAAEPEHAALAVTAQAVTAWHVDHPRCPRCGELTHVERSGWMRRCPADRSMHFPRTDPAVIVAVTDGAPDSSRERILLGQSAAWSGNRFSTLAGFVEPGESIEQAVVREIEEESGIVVDQVRYLGSQPWPFPRSLMIGCTAVMQYGQLTPDGDEIAQLRWFTRDELREASLSGEIVLPGKVSIARALIEHWLGENLPESGW